MADTISSSSELKILVGFVDEDDRTLTFPDPQATVTAEAVAALSSVMAPVLIGDKYGATFSRIKSARIVQTAETKVDLSIVTT